MVLPRTQLSSSYLWRNSLVPSFFQGSLSIFLSYEDRPSVFSFFRIYAIPNPLLEISDGSQFHNYPAAEEIVDNLIDASLASINSIKSLLECPFYGGDDRASHCVTEVRFGKLLPCDLPDPGLSGSVRQRTKTYSV